MKTIKIERKEVDEILKKFENSYYQVHEDFVKENPFEALIFLLEGERMIQNYYVFYNNLSEDIQEKLDEEGWNEEVQEFVCGFHISNLIDFFHNSFCELDEFDDFDLWDCGYEIADKDENEDDFEVENAIEEIKDVITYF